MKKIVILGGTGFVGRHVCEKLARLQCRVTIVTRRRGNARPLWTLPLVDVLELDVHDEAALTRAVAGHDAVVNLIAILHGNEAAFARAHVELPQKLARACTSAGVTRVVHMSALGADINAPSMYLRSKARGDLVLQDGVPLGLTLLRPSVIFGDGDRLLNLFAKLQVLFPVIPLAGASARFQPVWVEDVANAVVRCLQDERTAGQIYELAGPDVYTLRQLVQLAGRYSGCERPIFGLPAALGRLQARLMELAPGEPLMSRDNLASMDADNVPGGKLPGLADLGITPSPLTAIAPTYLGSDPGGHGQRSELLGMRRTAGRY